MKPITTKAQGIYPFAHFAGEVNWSDLPSVVAIQGDNGEGKTALLGLDFHALYGEDPIKARGTTADCVAFAGASEAWIETTFEVRAIRYRVRREVSISPRRHQAWLYRGDECLAGPKVTDTNAKVARLVGDAEIARATWFSAQGGDGDLCTLPVAGRRRVVAEILSLDTAQEWADTFKSRASETKGAAEAIEAELESAPDPAAEIAGQEAARDAAQNMIDDIRGKLPVAEANLAEARAALAKIEAIDLAALQADVDALPAARAALDAATERAERAERAVKAAEVDAAKLFEAEGDVARLATVRAENDGLLDRMTAFRSRQKWESERDRLAAADDAARRRVDDAKAAARVSPEDVSAAADLEALRVEYNRLESENKSIAELVAEIDRQRATLDAQLGSARGNLAQLDRNISSAPKTPGLPECVTCPLTERWARLPEQRAELVDEIARIEREIAALATSESPKPHDLSELRAKGEAARDAAARVKAAEKAFARIAELEKDVADANVKLMECELCSSPPCEDPTDALRETSAILAHLSGADERLERARDAARELPELADALDRAVVEVSGLGRALGRAEAKAEAAREKIERREADLEEARAVESGASAAVAKLREELDGATDTRANAVARIDALRRRRAELVEKRERAKELRVRLAGFKRLVEAFGPKGYQAIATDRAAPDLEAFIAPYLDEVFHGTARIRISTQSASKTDGSLREDFVIAYADADGERDVAAISGGEQRIARTAIRLGQADWIANLHGYRPEHIRLDEALDALDPENAAAVVGLIQGAGERIGQALVVTHDPDVAARFSARIIVRGGTVEIHGGKAA